MGVNIPDTFFTSSTSTVQYTTAGQLVGAILPNAIAAAGVIFFFLILGGGFTMIRSAGKTSSPQEAAKAKAAVTYGVIGFLIVVASYFILQLVETLTIGDTYNVLTNPNL